MENMIADLRNMAEKYFVSTIKGETHELRTELNSEYAFRRKEAVKRVIASMTVGKDVSNLFPDVVKNMQTDDLELKKLIYLYLINYAKSQPELVILAVNTFVKDTTDHNPLIRALAIRTMGCIRVDKITDYLCDPLRKALKDEDPYVRKTAAIAVSKLFDINPGLAIDNGFINSLLDLVSDNNPMVISNAITSLMEINEMSSGKKVFTITYPILTKLVRALNECSEWGQISILEIMSEYKPESSAEAQDICERVIPRLAHANASVVLSAIRVLLLLLEYIPDKTFHTKVTSKMAPPLVTLLSESPELQYVILRNLEIILQQYPTVLSKEIRVFFCKYTDPLYVKLEKLELMVKLVNEKNADQVLMELKEYSSEVDVDFVQRAIRAISRIALKIPASSPKCVQILVDLLSNKIDFIVQEVIIVMKDIFRKYPNKYEGVIPILSQHLEALESSEAKASLIWILGEYADRINDATTLLQSFLNNFKEETSLVQNQLLTAVVKLFLKKPNEAQEIVLKNLKIATEVENPDVRDRGYVYWRLLSTDPKATNDIILNERPELEEEGPMIHPQLAKDLMHHLSTLASVYHKLPTTFIKEERRVEVPQLNTNNSPPKDLEDLANMGAEEIMEVSQPKQENEPEELLIAF
ncbi:Adaptor protein complex beta subunit [Neoconidiobolus thromboides FSU 785]|nr:Adaptor protein complex beta subunit [Neoconidiobolus thromboides FSU 785]